jgi:phosphoglycerol transferase MdoB-like AlkP superfamily enzyme
LKLILLFFILCILSLYSYADSTDKQNLITQKFVYHASTAGEIYMVWGLKNWNLPENKYWPKSTFIKDNLAYSPMAGKTDSFCITISLQRGSQINFWFLKSKDRNGKKSNELDNYGGMNYYSVFVKDETIRFNDHALSPVIKYYLLHSGLLMSLASGILVFFLIWISGRTLKFRKTYFVTGLWLAALGMSIIIRVQMNGLFGYGRFGFPGTLFSDFLWLLFIGLNLWGLLIITRSNRLINQLTIFLSILVLLISILFSLVNIEIVNKLGRPLNYQWLYYSDFMQAVDAKNAISKTFSKELVLNLSLLLIASLLFGYAASWVLARMNTFKKMAVLWIPIVMLFFLGLYQHKTYHYRNSSTENPFISLITSFIKSERKAQLFSIPLSNESIKYIHDIHTTPDIQKYDTNGLIKNIVLFVFESTPRQFVSLYDSTFDVTPNLKRWKGASVMFSNIYAHIPSTPNTMFSLISGVYPLISYKSAVVENPKINLPSLPNELNKNGWISSLFFSSDLQYSRMDEYAGNQHFEIIKDYKKILCARNKMPQSHTELDGLDDQCLADEYLNWYDSNQNLKRFCILWTNQTHYPYFTQEENPHYTSVNKDLNQYLSALKNGDKAFGILMEGLKKRRVLDSTLVIVIGDHGEAFGTHKQTTHGSKIYEENIHIPCILYNPILFHGGVDQQLGGMIDIPATILHLAGIKKPKEWQGKSLLNPTNLNRTFFIAPYSDFLFGTRTGNWKFIYNASTDESELYNLAADPLELKNLASQYPSRVKSEYEIIAAWVQYHNRHFIP